MEETKAKVTKSEKGGFFLQHPLLPSCLKDADGARTRSDQKVNDYSGTIVSERRRWRTHTLGPKSQ